MGTITGNILIENGGLFVSGTVHGDIEQEGPGAPEGVFGGAPDASVTVGDSGLVHNITESGPGSVLIDGTVNGYISESDEGDVTLFSSREGTAGIFGTVNGNIEESGDGSVFVEALLNGGITELDDGFVQVGIVRDVSDPEDPMDPVDVRALEGTVNGHIEESGDGGVLIIAGSSVNGNVMEKDAGGVLVGDGTVLVPDMFPTGVTTLNGNIEEEGDGFLPPFDAISVFIDAGDAVGGNGLVISNVMEKDAGMVSDVGMNVIFGITEED